MCPTPGCAQDQPCGEHAPKPWANASIRRTDHQTMTGWQRQARARRVITRDKGICHVCGHPGADEADHVVAQANGGAETDEALKAIHGHTCPTCGLRCHNAKTVTDRQTPPAHPAKAR